jgi:hypothetical protein
VVAVTVLEPEARAEEQTAAEHVPAAAELAYPESA